MKILGSPLFISASVLVGIAAIGYVDFTTGVELRIFPLYFLPLVFAANRLGTSGAIIASVWATLVWFLSNFLDGNSHSNWFIWPINIITQGIVFLMVALLVSRLKNSIIREQALSQKDPLTGLLNSRAYHEQAEHALALCHRNRRPVTVAFMDLDNFKKVNDIAGHQQGDELLKSVAEILFSLLRSSDIVARIGGDEFAIFLPEVDEIQAHMVLNKIKQHLQCNEKFIAFGVSASIGAVVYQEAPERLAEMLQKADKLMYLVKSAGKNGLKITTA